MIFRSITKKDTDKEAIKETAEDATLTAVQGPMTVAGQIMGFLDKLKNLFRGKPKNEMEPHAPAGDQLATPPAEAPSPTEDLKRARREPVIFTPHPTEFPTPDTSQPDRPAATVSIATVSSAVTEPITIAPVAVVDEPVIAEPVLVVEPVAVVAETVAIAVETVVDEPAEVELVVVDEPVLETVAVAAESIVVDEPVMDEAVVADEAVIADETVVDESATGEVGLGEDAGLVEPVPGYAGLTVASLRARMRGKSAAQIQAQLDYERATTGRPEVVKMFETRLAKMAAAE